MRDYRDDVGRDNQRTIEAARTVNAATRQLANLVDSGARHAGGHRSGKRWVDDINKPGLGYWQDIAKVQAAQAWDLGVNVKPDHPFAA